MRPVGPSRWRSDLRRPAAALLAMAGLLVSAPVATVVACNVHELGHAAVGTIVGWEVERIDLCLPSGGAVVYARVGVWAGNVQGYAGGVTAAVFLFVTYLLVFARRAKPLQGPGWWFAGLGVVLWVGPQLVIGVLEGAVGPGEDYTRRYASVLLPSTLTAMAAGVAAYAWRWRDVWTE